MPEPRGDLRNVDDVVFDPETQRQIWIDRDLVGASEFAAEQTFLVGQASFS